MNNNITIITTLYKTPPDKLKNLNQYKSFKLKFLNKREVYFLKKIAKNT